MRILIRLIFLVLLFPALCFGNVAVMGEESLVVVAPPGDHSDVIGHINGDGTLVDNTYTLTSTETGPEAATKHSGIVFSGTSALIGSNGVGSSGTSDGVDYTVDIDSGLLQFAFRFVFKTSYPGTSTTFIAGFEIDSNNYCKVAPRNSNNLRLGYRANGGTAVNIDMSTATLIADTEYVVLVQINDSTPSRKISVYDNSLSLLDSAEDTNAFTKPSANFSNFFIDSGSIANPIYWDNKMWSNLIGAPTRNFIIDIHPVSGNPLINTNDTPNP